MFENYLRITAPLKAIGDFKLIDADLISFDSYSSLGEFLRLPKDIIRANSIYINKIEGSLNKVFLDIGVDNTVDGDYALSLGNGNIHYGTYTSAFGYLNIAGMKAFKIYDHNTSTKTIRLDSVDGLEVGMYVQTTYMVTNQDGILPQILEINTESNTVVLSELITIDNDYHSDNFLYVPNSPHLGDLDIGYGSHAEGISTKALYSSHAEGCESVALGKYSHSEGYGTNAEGASSHAEGSGSISRGRASHAEGESTKALDIGSHAEGFGTTASGQNAHAEGHATTASGRYSHTEGDSNTTGCRGFNILAIDPVGYDSMETSPTEMRLTLDSVEGLAVNDSCSVAINKNYIEMGKITSISENTITINAYPDDLTAAIISTTVVGGGEELAYVFVSTKQTIGTTIFGSAQHAEGYETAALMVASHAEGGATVASGKYSHAEGDSTFAGYAAHAEGQRTKALGGVSHAEGSDTTASGIHSHAEGQLSTASGRHSHAEGYQTTAEGKRAHSEGYKTSATGEDSHSEGNLTTASGEQSHAEGQGTTASGWVAHAEGYKTSATENKSHAEGDNTAANAEASHAEGHNTVASGYASHAEGFGSNLSEGLLTQATATAAHAEGEDTCASAEAAHAEGNNTTASGYAAHAEGNGTLAEGYAAHAEGQRTTASGYYAHAEGQFTTASDYAAHAEGQSTTASGYYAHAEGYSTTASGTDSHAEGFNTVASDHAAHAEGNKATASGQGAHAEGGSTLAQGYQSHAEGESTKAYAKNSHAEGNGTTTGSSTDVDSGHAAHAEGTKTTASGRAAHAEGTSTTASALGAHAEGQSTTASGSSSHAEGFSTTASGTFSHAEGQRTTADGQAAHAEGDSTTASSTGSHAEGSCTKASGPAAHAEGNKTTARGHYAHAEGDSTTASSTGSHAEGESTKAYAKNSHAEGNGTTANAEAAHAEGHATVANGKGSHSEGFSEGDAITTASGQGAHAEGTGSVASGEMSHAEGYKTTASGAAAHAEGNGTTASELSAHAEGMSTTASGYFAHAEGQSTTASGSDSHAEGFSTTASGEDAHAEGNQTTASGYAAHAEGSGTTASEYCSHAEGYTTTASGRESHAEGYTTTASGNQSHAEGNETESSGTGSHAEGVHTKATGQRSHAEGSETTASGWGAHAEGELTSAIGEGSHAEGSGSYSYGPVSHAEGRGSRAGIKDNVTAGDSAHAEGRYTTASGQGAHAEGNSTLAQGYYSHAEGMGSKAYGHRSHAEGNSTVAGIDGQANATDGAHAEGVSTTASGKAAHAEGSGSIASGESSHAEGYHTIASKSSQHVQGKFNIEDTTSNGKYAHIVGNGTSDTNRSNAHTLDWNGNAWFAGDVTIGTGNERLVRETELVAAQEEIERLKTAVEGGIYTFSTNDTPAYMKNIPSNALPYASLETLGGRTSPKINRNIVSLQFDLDKPYKIKNDKGKTMFTVTGRNDNKGFVINSEVNTIKLRQLKYYNLRVTDYFDELYNPGDYFDVKLKKYRKEGSLYYPDANGNYVNDTISGEYFNVDETTFYCGHPTETNNYEEDVEIGNYIYEEENNALYRKISLELLTPNGNDLEKNLWRAFEPEWSADSTEEERIEQYGKYIEIHDANWNYTYYQAVKDESGNYITIDFCKKTADSEYFIGAADLPDFSKKPLSGSGLVIDNHFYPLYNENFEKYVEEDNDTIVLVTTKESDNISTLGTGIDEQKFITYSYGLSSVNGTLPSRIKFPVKKGFNLAQSNTSVFTVKTKRNDSYNTRDGEDNPYIDAGFTTEQGNWYTLFSLHGSGEETFERKNNLDDDIITSASICYDGWGALTTYSNAKCIFSNYTVDVELDYVHEYETYEPVKVTEIKIGNRVDTLANKLNPNTFTEGILSYDSTTKEYTLNGTLTSDTYEILHRLTNEFTVFNNGAYHMIRVRHTGGSYSIIDDGNEHYNSFEVAIWDSENGTWHWYVGMPIESSIGTKYGFDNDCGWAERTIIYGMAIRYCGADVQFNNFKFTLEFGDEMITTVEDAKVIKIPEEVQNIEGYGVGKSYSLYNFINFESLTFVRRCKLNDEGTVEAISPPESVDVSPYFNNGDINVKNKNVIVFENDSKEAVANRVTYQIKL